MSTEPRLLETDMEQFQIKGSQDYQVTIIDINRLGQFPGGLVILIRAALFEAWYLSSRML